MRKKAVIWSAALVVIVNLVAVPVWADQVGLGERDQAGSQGRLVGLVFDPATSVVQVLPVRSRNVVNSDFDFVAASCLDCGGGCPPVARGVQVVLRANTTIPGGYGVSNLALTNYSVTEVAYSTQAALSAGDLLTITITGDVLHCGVTFKLFLSMCDTAPADPMGPCAETLGTLYWSDRNLGTINQAKVLAGGGLSAPIRLVGVGNNSGVEVDKDAGRIYMSSSHPVLRYSKLDGTGVSNLVHTGAAALWKLELDNGVLYFNSHPAGVGRVSVDGTGLTWIGDNYPGESVALDSVNGHVYYQIFNGSYSLRRTNADGSGAPVTILGSYRFAPSLAVDTVNGKLYAANAQDRAIQRMNLDGSGLETLATGYSFYTVELDVARNTVFFGTAGTPAVIGRMDLDGSDFQVLLSGLSYVYDIDLVLD